MSLRILHLAAHYGGGVGTVIRALIGESQRLGGYTHQLACLEAASDGTRAWAGRLGVMLADRLQGDDKTLQQLLRDADVVHLHWWHHPLLNAMMHRHDLPAFRCLLWTHVNGHYPPQNFPQGLADYPDVLILATSWSRKAPVIAEASAKGQDIRVVRSSAGFPTMPPRTERISGPPRVGYVGTVDPIKMHPDFVRLCVAADLPGKILVAGGSCHQELQAEARALGAEERFDILGPVDDVAAVMTRLDVFAYPLNPQHYGTGEQVLLEAVAAGALPVVLGTENEREILTALSCGIMTDREEAFISALKRIIADQSAFRRKRDLCASPSSTSFSLSKMVFDWHELYAEIAGNVKRNHRMSGIDDVNPSGYELLIAASQGTELASLYARLVDGSVLNKQEADAIPLGCFSLTRGSCFHYQTFFDDLALDKIGTALASTQKTKSTGKQN